MRLRSITLNNIGIFESAKAEIGRDAAAIVGKNNSGKTTLLAAMSMQVRPEPPRTARVARLAQAQLAQLKKYVLWEFEIETADVVDLCRTQGHVVVPITPDVQPHAALQMVAEGRLRGVVESSARGEAGFNITSGIVGRPATSVVFESKGDLLKYKGKQAFEPVHKDPLLAGVAQLMFRYDADRSRASEKLVRPLGQLDSRGDELITAFNGLSSQRKLEFLAIVQRVLPEVTRLESVPSRDGHTELRLWFGSDDRARLGFNLAEVGYGTANVLALVFVATMDPGRRIILIDEPATYLHPSAVRELMSILAANPQHQYVFATHSFSGLEHFPNASFSLCQRVPGQDVATVVNCGSGESADVRLALREVGASLSDVFAADRVIWTEGVSDADVLKIVLQDANAPRGISVLPIIHTGDFDASDIKPDKAGKRRSLAAHIYESLSKNSALIPPALAFVFDREKRSQAQLDDLKRQIEGNGPTKRDRPRFFLYDEFMLENLFLDPDLIVELMNQVAADPERPAAPAKPIATAAVEALWNTYDDPKYPAPKRAENPDGWRTNVHGAHVLEATFDSFFDGTVEFIKAKHDPMLARLALKLDAPAAKRLRAFGKRILEAVKDTEGAV